MALRDITLGQYFPGQSLIHRFDPRAKLLYTLLFIVSIFVAESLISYGVLLLTLVLGILLSRIKLKVFLRGLKPLLILVLLTAILNLFFTPGETLLFSFGVLHITMEGVRHAILMMLRITMLLLSTLLMTYTTSPLMLTDGLDRLMQPLKVFKVPVHDFTMIMSIALRFIPTLIQETDKIISAQRARGADFDSGNLLRRAKALIPILIPLFISAFRRAEELSVAMDCRCYHGGEGRTRLRQLKFSVGDILLLLLSLLLLAGTILLRVFGL